MCGCVRAAARGVPLPRPCGAAARYVRLRPCRMTRFGQCSANSPRPARKKSKTEVIYYKVVTKLDKKAVNVVQYLKAAKRTAATAESCTGGLLSGAVTAAAGASEVFGFGVCTYANEAKIKLLSVKPETLAAHGAVSEETAMEMAAGIRALSGADYGISTTGIAGPGGGTTEKPVGTVWIGFSSEKKTFAVRNVFRGDGFPEETEKRAAIRKEAVLAALTLLERELLSEE